MAGYSFANREDIQRVLDRTAREPFVPDPGQGAGGTGETEFIGQLTRLWLYKTPAGGIPPKGSVMCTPYYVSASGNEVELKDDDGESQTQTIYNIFSSEIEENTLIIVGEIFGRKVVIAEDCPPGFI